MKYYTSMFHLSKQVKQEHVAESQLVTNIDVYKQYILNSTELLFAVLNSTELRWFSHIDVTGKFRSR